MKKILIMTACCLIVTLAGCTNLDNYGYPKSLSFGKEGGQKVVKGDDGIYHLTISNYNGDGNYSDGDSIIVTYEWLTVKCAKFDDTWTIIAEPNTTGKNRKLYVYGAVDDGDAEMTIKQSR